VAIGPTLRFSAPAPRSTRPRCAAASRRPAAASRSLAVEEQPRVHVPRATHERAVDRIRVPRRGEVLRRASPSPSAPRRSRELRARPAPEFGIHVVPSWNTSGIESPTNAVSSFSCAALHGSGCTRTDSARWRARSREPARPRVALVGRAPGTGTSRRLRRGRSGGERRENDERSVRSSRRVRAATRDSRKKRGGWARRRCAKRPREVPAIGADSLAGSLRSLAPRRCRATHARCTGRAGTEAMPPSRRSAIRKLRGRSTMDPQVRRDAADDRVAGATGARRKARQPGQGKGQGQLGELARGGSNNAESHGKAEARATTGVATTTAAVTTTAALPSPRPRLLATSTGGRVRARAICPASASRRKHNGCMPPGQAKKRVRDRQPLPAGSWCCRSRPAAAAPRRPGPPATYYG